MSTHTVEVTLTLNVPDWIAGMFMLLLSEVFEQAGGFDERYCLYYENVHLCCAFGFSVTVARWMGMRLAPRPAGEPPQFAAFQMASRERAEVFRFGRLRSLQAAARQARE
jgi:hypothetical protein